MRGVIVLGFVLLILFVLWLAFKVVQYVFHRIQKKNEFEDEQTLYGQAQARKMQEAQRLKWERDLNNTPE